MKDDFLGVGRFVGQNACTANFRSGARSGWHGDDWGNGLAVRTGPPVAYVFKIPDRPCLSCLKGNQLAKVQRRTATKCDDAIMLAALENLDTRVEIAFDRVGFHIGKHSVFDASFVQNSEC